MTSFGIYKSYKIATNAFTAGVVKFADENNICSKKMKITTVSMDTLIEKITSSSVPVSVLTTGLASALKAGKLAIKLRDEMQLFYPTRVTTGDASYRHINFNECMRRWYTSLYNICSHETVESKTTFKVDPPTSTPSQQSEYGRYSVLTDDDTDDVAEFADATRDIESDYFDMTTEESLKKVARAGLTMEEIKKCLQDELFFTVTCLFADMDMLFKKVALAWIGVKNQEVSVIAATAVTLTAIRFVNSLEAEFQLKYPDLDSTEVVYSACLVKMENFHSTMKASETAWTENRQPFEFYPGSLLYGFEYLAYFLSEVGKVPCGAKLKRGVYGPAFHEDYFPLQSPDTDKAFIFAEILKLGKFYSDITCLSMLPEDPAPGCDMSELFFNQHELLGVFVNQFKPVFEKKRPTLSTCFTMCCWLKSVYSLQGDRFISRTFSLTKFAVMNVAEMVRKAFDGWNFPKSSKPDIIFVLKVLLESTYCRVYEKILDFPEVFVTNPFMSGALLTEVTMSFLRNSMDMVGSTHPVRVVCQLYHAMRELEVVNSIPLLESLIGASSNYIFGASKPTQGNFVSNFLLQTGFGIETTRRILKVGDGHTYKDPRAGGKACDSYDGRTGSILYEVLLHEYYGDIPNIKNLSMSKILDYLQDRAMYEQFDPASRVLGLSFLSVLRSAHDFMHEFGDKFSALFVSASELEPAVAGAMDFLVCLDSFPGIDKMRLHVSNQQMTTMQSNMEVKKDTLCLIVRELLEKHFCHTMFLIPDLVPPKFFAPYSTTGVVFSEKFFFLPQYVQAHAVEFGSHGLAQKENIEIHSSSVWIQIFENIEPLTHIGMLTYIDYIKAYPFFLNHVSPGKKLYSQLHHAAAGVVKDCRLFEFLVQLGANDLVCKNSYLNLFNFKFNYAYCTLTLIICRILLTMLTKLSTCRNLSMYVLRKEI